MLVIELALTTGPQESLGFSAALGINEVLGKDRGHTGCLFTHLSFSVSKCSCVVQKCKGLTRAILIIRERVLSWPSQAILSCIF